MKKLFALLVVEILQRIPIRVEMKAPLLPLKIGRTTWSLLLRQTKVKAF